MHWISPQFPSSPSCMATMPGGNDLFGRHYSANVLLVGGGIGLAGFGKENIGLPSSSGLTSRDFLLFNETAKPTLVSHSCANMFLSIQCLFLPSLYSMAGSAKHRKETGTAQLCFSPWPPCVGGEGRKGVCSYI